MKNNQAQRSWKRKSYLVVIHLLLGSIAAIAFASIFGFLVKLLWAESITPIFNLPPISYWQGICLVLMARLLFGALGSKHGHGSHGSKKSSQDDVSNDRKSAEDELSGLWLDGAMAKQYKTFWKNEGQEAFIAYLDKTSNQNNDQGEK